MGAQRWSFHPDDAVNLAELDPDGRHAYQGPYDYILAADHDRIVAEAEARGWNLGARAALEDLHPHSPFCASRSPDRCTCGNTEWVDSLLAALRKPEVEG